MWHRVQFQNARHWVEEKILRLDISVTDPHKVDVGQRPEQLVHVELETAV